MSATSPRVGMFGGAFDPPHNAHLALAQAAIAQLKLDRLHVLPTGDAWHKTRGLTAATHRLAMTRLAFEGLPEVAVDDRELKRSGPTYSIDTLRELAAEHPGAALFLLMGADQAASFTTWRDWEGIAALATLAVASRGPAEGLDALQALPGVRAVAIALPRRPESATDIRARLAAGQDIRQLVPPSVAGYIARYRLYAPN